MSDLNNKASIQSMAANGLWHNNPAIMQLLGLCPLLAVSNNLVNAFTLGIATIIVLVISNTVVSLLRKYITSSIRVPYFMLIIASSVTMIILYMQAYNYSLYKTLGVYLALITTNCVILGRIEAYAYKNNVKNSILDGVFNGLGFSLVLIILGVTREIIGQGTICNNCNLLFGSVAVGWTLNINNHITYNNFLLAILPPGAFLAMGFIIALKNYINIYKKNTTKPEVIHVQKASLSEIPTITNK